MRIGIDARFYGSIGKGLGRYTQKLIEQLENIDKKNQYVIFLRKENFDEYISKNDNFKKVLADFQWYSFSEQIFFPFVIKKYNLDLVHFPHFNVPVFFRGKFIITIHDLILLRFPTIRNTTLNPFWYKIKYIAYRICIASAIKRAQHILTVSNFTKKEIIKHYGTVENKIFVTYEATEDHCLLCEQSDEDVFKKYGIMKPYLLYVGNAYPHKNLERLVEAFSLVLKKKPNFQLVLVGKHDYFYNRLHELVKQKKIANVILPGFIPDDELSLVYREAHVYVFPSLHEGFGLPPLEAMSVGAPVVSSDHECMREILGDSAWYMDARNVDNIASSLLEFLELNEGRDEYIEKGYRQAEKYNWTRMAKDTLAQYQNRN